MKIQTDNMLVEDLLQEQLIEINGGESAWYAIAYYTTQYIKACNTVNKIIWYSAAKCDVAL